MSRPLTPGAGFIFAVLAMLAFAVTDAAAALCAAESGARRVALLELYTSEGCDSCPPADRWISALPARGLDPERVVTLGFHVDYWNYLGWNDPFAKTEYSIRQRAASQRNKARVVYTPQLLLNGADYRRGNFKDDFADRVNTINQKQPGARISLKLATGSAGELSVQGAVAVADAAQKTAAQVHLAVYENNLANAVTSGENRGKQLRHDFVVRVLAGPFPVGPTGEVMFTHRFRLDTSWKSADLRVVSFVQNEITGDVLQALALPVCR
jgi:hypothetical protein